MEQYHFSNGKVFTFLNNSKEWGVSFNGYVDFIQASIKKQKIDTILPRKYIAVFGCSPNKRTIRKSKKIKNTARKQGFVIENYLKIETLIDPITNQIYVSFLIPKYGVREVEISYGPYYVNPELENWLN
jgi:hypothetical protein